MKELIDKLYSFLANPELDDMVSTDTLLLDLYSILFEIGSRWEYYKLVFEQED